MASTREQFIQATCELLELQGYYGTGLNQIIRESGSPKGSLYYHFPGGKDELAAEAVQHVGQIVLKRIDDHLNAVDDSAEAVRRFIENIATNIERSDFRAGGPITTVALETAATNDALRIVCDEIYQSWERAFAQRLERGAMPTATAARIARVIIAGIEGAIILCRTRRSTQPMQDVAQAMQDLIEGVQAATE